MNSARCNVRHLPYQRTPTASTIAVKMRLPTIVADADAVVDTVASPLPDSETLQARKQRQNKQRSCPENESKHEWPEPAAARLFGHRGPAHLWRSERMLAL